MTRGGATWEDGRAYCRAVVGTFEVTRLVFPSRFRHGAVDPEQGYVVVVLQGAVAKSFRGGTTTLGRDMLSTLPAGAAHASAFPVGGAQVLTVRAADEQGDAILTPLLSERRHMRAAGATGLGWRIAGELEARDPSWALALEGLVLELLAAGERAATDQVRGEAGWLGAARDLLHETVPHPPTLTELAAAMGRHPAHVARAFRREHGVTVAEYARGLRLEWVRARLALDDAPIAELALEAGFADQSHLTRAFRRWAGVTPARYRELVRRP